MKLRYILPAVAALALAASAAYAATDTASLTVNATVPFVCDISATSALAFGDYASTANKDAEGTLSYTCTSTTGAPGVSIAFPDTLAMIGGPSSESLSFTLYQNTGRTTAWDSTSSPMSSGFLLDGSSHALTVYGRIPSGQTVNPGSYTGTAVATMTF